MEDFATESKEPDVISADETERGKVRAWEIVLYALLPVLLVFAGVKPIWALPALFVALPILYLQYRRFGIYLPEAVVLCYGALALSLNYDILTVIYSVALFFAVVGLAAAVQFPYIPALAICAIATVLGAFTGVGIVCGAEGAGVGAVEAKYVTENYDDPVIRYLARDYYDQAKLPPDEERIELGQPGYDDAVIKSFAEYMRDENASYIFYDCIHISAVCIAFAFVLANIINGRTSGRWDTDGGESKSRLLASGVKKPATRIADMRLPRSFLWAVALPATAAGIAMGFVDGLDVPSATVMHAFVTLPGAFACFTLLAYFASLFRGRAKNAATVVLVIAGLAAVTVPIALFVMSVLGVCDCILDLRYWTEYISRD